MILKRTPRARRALALCAAAALSGGAVRAADVTSSWIGQTANWSTPQLWSNSNGAIIYPNNGNLGLTYDAIVNQGNVALDQNITIDHLIMNGTGTVTNSQFTLTLAQGGTWLSGSLTGTGTTSIAAGGTFAIGTDGTSSQFLTDQRLVNRGTINFADSFANQNQSLIFLRTATIANAGTFNITRDGHLSADGTGTFNNSGTLVKSGTGIAVIDSPITFNNSGTVSVTGGVLEILGGGTQSGAFNLAGSNTFVVGGAGTQTFTAASKFTGDAASVFFQDSTNVTINGTYNVGRTVVRGQATVNFDGTSQFTSTLGIGGGTVNVNTTLTTNNLTLSGGSLNILGQLFSQHVTLSGGSTTVGQPPIIIFARPGTLSAVANAGGGPLLSTTQLTVVSGSNICEPGATMAVGSGGVVFSGNASPTLTLVSDAAAPGLLQLGGDVTFTGTDGTAGVVNSGPVPIPGTIDLMAGQRNFTVNDGAAAVDMQISAQLTNGSIRKDGAGMLQLSGASTFAGGTTIAGGTLEADTAGALGTGAITFAGGTLRLAVPSPATLSNPLIAAPTDSISLDIGTGNYTIGQLTLGAALNVAGTGSVTFTGPITLPSPVGPLTINSTAGITLAAPVNGGLGIIKLPGGSLTFSGAGANTYGGTTQVLGGNLILSKPAGTVAVPGDLAIVGASTVMLTASDQIASNSNVTFNSTGGSPVLNLNGQNQTVGMISSIQSNAGAVQLGAGTLTVGGSGAGTFGGSIQGTGRLVKSGTGTLTLAGANTFGGLTVGGGTLRLAADQHVNSLISTGGTLDVRASQLFVTYPFILFPPINLDPAQTIRADLQTGAITSSLNTANTRVGLADSADGVDASLPPRTLLLKRARIGDLNLDGTVNFADLLDLAQHYGQTNRIWDQGDVTYDGSVNFTDLLLLAQNYNGTLSAVEAPAAAFAQVPEPGFIALGVSCGAMLLSRRRKLCL